MSVLYVRDKDGRLIPVGSSAAPPDLSDYVRSVNGVEPDENGNVEITIPDSGGNVDLTGVVKSVNGKTPDANGNVKIEVPSGTANIYAGATAPTDGSLVWIDTTEDGELAPEIDSEAWIPGYTLNAQGGLSAVSNDTKNTAANYAFIPVEGGAIYTLYNSKDKTWTSDLVYINMYTNDSADKSEHIALIAGNPFTVPKSCAYILIASQNVDAENFANMRLVKGTLIPDEEPDEPGGDTTGIVLNPDNWKCGYIGGATINNSSTNGEMYYEEYIPVTPGAQYCLYNTNKEWTTGWWGIGYYADDKTFVKRDTGSSGSNNITHCLFTVPDTAVFARPSARNMVNYYETAAMCKYEDYPAPNMPFDSTTWKRGTLNKTLFTENSEAPVLVSDHISVEVGATYRFANTNAEWKTGSGKIIRVSFYKNLIPLNSEWISDSSSTYNVSSLDFTIPDGTKYIRIRADNLPGYEDTATLTKIS